MTLEQYKSELREIELLFKLKKNELIKTYLKANASHNIGDVCTDHIGSIRVEKYLYEYDTRTQLPVLHYEGTALKWSSSSNGSTIEKKGKIVHVIPKGKQPFEVIDKPTTLIKYSVQFDGMSRNIESYLVEVESSKKAKPKLYWPRVSALELI